MEVNPYAKFVEKAPSTNELAELSKLADDLYLAQLKVEQAEIALAEAQATVRDLSEHQIPELMEKVGMESFTTSTGLVVQVKPDVRAGITEANSAAAFAWLEEHEFGSMIKHSLIVGLGRDSDELAEELRAELEGRELLVKDSRKVEPMTLKAWAKRELEAGTNIPMDLFNIHRYKKTSITQKKESVFGEDKKSRRKN